MRIPESWNRRWATGWRPAAAAEAREPGAGATVGGEAEAAVRDEAAEDGGRRRERGREMARVRAYGERSRKGGREPRPGRRATGGRQAGDGRATVSDFLVEIAALWSFLNNSFSSNVNSDWFNLISNPQNDTIDGSNDENR